MHLIITKNLVAKKSTDIKKLINSSGVAFYKYLHLLLHEDIMKKLEDISLSTDVYIFSGIIRNYFLKVYLKRDIDVVLGQEINIDHFFKELPFRKNSFGGYKIIFPSGPLDLWFIKDTWAFQHSQKTLDFDLEKKIPDTAFFNFSSIIFSLNKKSFYYTEDFVKFLRYKKLDFVYKENPNYGLCIVNTFYYSDRFRLKIANKLLKFIKSVNEMKSYDFEDIQIRHFGEIFYTSDEINIRLESNNTNPINKSFRVR